MPGILSASAIPDCTLGDLRELLPRALAVGHFASSTAYLLKKAGLV